jgi:hypothetical protein
VASRLGSLGVRGGKGDVTCPGAMARVNGMVILMVVAVVINSKSASCPRVRSQGLWLTQNPILSYMDPKQISMHLG